MDNNTQKITDLIQNCQNNPILFSEKILNITLEKWQKKVLISFLTEKKISIRSGHGVGKTTLISILALYFLFKHNDAKIIITAPKYRQLAYINFTEMAKWIKKSLFLKHIFEINVTKITTAQNGYILGETATFFENLQGFHADDLLYVVDEASGVDDKIFETILGSISGKNNKIVIAGNPTKNTGFFFKTFTDSNFHRIKISALDSGLTNKKNIDEIIKEYGISSNMVRVRVLGEPPIQQTDGFFDKIKLEKVLYDPLKVPEHGDVEVISIGCDVARYGDDETVIAVKINNIVLPLINYHGKNLVWTTSKIIFLINEYIAKYSNISINIFIDDGGLGGGVTDFLKKEVNKLPNINIHPVLFGIGVKSRLYGDSTTVMAVELKKQIESADIKLPNDFELITQLTDRGYIFDSKSRILLESKKELKKRGLKSPDKADALLMVAQKTEIVSNRQHIFSSKIR